MTSTIIECKYQDIPVFFQSDAFINATKAAKHFNKKVGDYLRLERTQEYINELSVAGFPVTKENQLVIKRQGGKAEEQGTWLHPKLTIDFARWLSAKFAIWCDAQIEKILHGNPEPKKLEYATVEQRRPLVNAVRRLVKVSEEKGKNLSYENAHSIINLKMGVDSIEELTLEQIPHAMTLVGHILEKIVLEGEFIAKGEAEPKPQAYQPYHKISSSQRQELSKAIDRAFLGWMFSKESQQHAHNYLRGVFSLQSIADLPEENFQQALDLIKDVGGKNRKIFDLISEILDIYLKEQIMAGAPWTPDLKRKWKALYDEVFPERPDWQVIKKQIETKQATLEA